MRYQGKVAKWFDDKGYGFVSTEATAEQVFLHISAIQKGQTTPAVGEELTFEITHDNKKGPQAYNVFFPDRPASELNVSEYKANLYEQSHVNQEPIRLKVKAREQVSTYTGGERKQKKPRDLKTVMYMVFFGWLVMTVYQTWQKPETGVAHEVDASVNELVEQPAMVKGAERFQCAGKKHCSEMNSCDEAMYYLKNCPGTIMDGDGDGLPCEDQWCR